MSEEQEAPSVIIPVEHQSAPAEHWMIDEVRKAAEEIESGKFKPELAADDYFYSGPEQLIAMHPRVQEAMARFEQEIPKAKNTQEAIEKAQMLHEINENLQAGDKWDGQGRWIGKENEEMRQGELLTPVEFVRRLWDVVGENRVQINRFAVLGRVALLVDEPDYDESKFYKPPIIGSSEMLIRTAEKALSKESFKQRMTMLEASFSKAESAQYTPPDYLKGKAQVATLQHPLGTEWMVMKFDSYGVPQHAKFLGWRTALMSMMMLGVITEEEAHKAFPLKHLNAASLWYRAQLYAMRNGGEADA